MSGRHGAAILRLAISLTATLAMAVLGSCAREPRPTPTGFVVSEGSPTRAAFPTLPDTPGAAGEGLPNAGSRVQPGSAPQVHTVRQGDTLSAIAAHYGVSVDALARANQLADPNRLQVGQSLNIPGTATEVGPSTRLLPDSEFVNGPAYVHFDLAAFCVQRGGYLANYSEMVGGTLLSGPEIVRRVVHQYSVGPRMLLAVLESMSGWVTDPNPSGTAISAPLGTRPGATRSLWRELVWAANELNRGYYDWRGRGAAGMAWSDGSVTAHDASINAATAGLQSYYSKILGKTEWERMVGTGPGGFLDTYRRLFGDPAQYAVEPHVSVSTPLPELALPWPEDEEWLYTGGPHGAWGEGSAWAAIDVVPNEGPLGCQVARSWATAAAPGLVIYSQDGYVMIDLDGDGREETGWVLLYLHMANQGRVAAGSKVCVGDRIGHPSCEGGVGNASHLHFARKFNGEWIAADGPLPLILSGWQFHSSGTSYHGTASRSDEVREARESWQPEINGLAR